MSFTYILTLILLLNFHQFSKSEIPNHHGNTLGTYIVHVDHHVHESDDIESFYDSFMPTTDHSLASPTNDDQPRILYRYTNVFSGFAAKLSADDVDAMRQKPGFVSARPERVFHLHTTHTPNFLGLSQNLGFWKNSSYGKGVIVGLLDTGIAPDHPSFSDKGIPVPPSKWKGKCEFNNSTTACNNKLIGARYFRNGNQTPFDEDGHGTHTSSTAAGNFVEGAGIFGNAEGTAAGIAPLAHVAMYKVCVPTGCAESDIIAGMDAAIDDGVDVLSISLGGGQSSPFYHDNIALGAYRATEKGIVVSCSAGNDGPTSTSLSNEAPWILTVGASTIDRKIKATAVLGNGRELNGETAFQPKGFPSIEKLQLVYPGPNDNDTSVYCGEGEIVNDVRGKIVLCKVGGSVTRVDKGKTVKNAGGAAMILMNLEAQGDTTRAEAHVLPAIHVNYEDALKIKSYVSSTNTPIATISFHGTVIGDKHAPVVASFSSRGPSNNSPGILKPDIIGPGVNILAAWPVSVENKTDTNANFNMISGTSMSCPHLSGVAALLKSAHPDWSPAAIKSAIMTTADQVNLGGEPILDELLLPADVFAIGAGHVNPSCANDPGLVYDIGPDEYTGYLCGLNYTSQEVGIIVQRRVDCSKEASIPEGQLNYPSFSVILGSTSQTYTRIVTNVGKPDSTYDVEIGSPKGVDLKVEPAKLRFSKLGQKLSYNVTFTKSAIGVKSDYGQGFIKWNSGNYGVRTPIAVLFG